MNSRRHFLQTLGAGFGWMAFSALAAGAKQGHFPARAKRVIFLFMQGGPSHLDTFDYKPELAKAAAASSGGGKGFLAPVFDFRARGRSGLMISDAFPRLSEHADELCLLNGMRTATASHAQATVALHTGTENFVRPSLGSWVVYGLGSVAEDLPGFITIDPLNDQGGAMNYGAAFLPAIYQGTPLGGGQRGLPDIANRSLTPAAQRTQLDFVQRLNRRLKARHPGDSEIEGVIQSYELAYKMQTSVPGVLGVESESAATQALYGLNESATAGFGRQCLLARRLAERGVRFIQVTQGAWDHHNQIRSSLGMRAASIDQPIAGLITDLKQRGMLEETLIVWGGEFGRGARNDKGSGPTGGGRGHNNKGYTMWMAGGGVKGGYRHGATDELGEVAVEGEMNTHDLHATLLHLLGLDHELLTYRYAGRDFRLTNVSGRVAKDVIS